MCIPPLHIRLRLDLTTGCGKDKFVDNIVGENTALHDRLLRPHTLHFGWAISC